MATSVLSVNELDFLNTGSSYCKFAVNSNGVLNLSSTAGNVDVLGIVASPSDATSAASKAYVDSVSTGLHWLAPVRVATTQNGTLSTAYASGQTVDGVLLSSGDRILLKNQTTGTENGVYVGQLSGSPQRAEDIQSGDSAVSHAVFVSEGTVNADNGFVCTNDTGSGVVGTDALVFVQFSGAGQIIAGDALSKTGNTLDVKVDDSTIEVNSDALRVKDAGITNSKLANSSLTLTAGNGLASTLETIPLGSSGTLSVNVDDSSIEISTDALQVKALGITDAMLAGSISNSKLTNSSLDVVAGTGISTTAQSISLGGSSTLSVDFSEVVRTSTSQSIAGVKTFSDTTNSTSTLTGAIITVGGVGVAQDIYAGGLVSGLQFNTTSDQRKKQDIYDIKEDFIDKLRPVEYKFIGQKEKKYGMIAQEVSKLLPDIVSKDSEGFLSLDYTSIFSLLVKYCQRLEKRVSELEKNK